MAERVFIDTNILIYYFSKDPVKFPVVEALLTNTGLHFVTSTQVLSEFTSVILKKYVRDSKKVKQFLKEISAVFEVISFTGKDIELAIDIKEQYLLSLNDSLVIVNALKSNCTKPYSEDMHHHLKLAKKLQIVNPFK